MFCFRYIIFFYLLFKSFLPSPGLISFISFALGVSPFTFYWFNNLSLIFTCGLRLTKPIIYKLISLSSSSADVVQLNTWITFLPAPPKYYWCDLQFDSNLLLSNKPSLVLIITDSVYSQRVFRFNDSFANILINSFLPVVTFLFSSLLFQTSFKLKF